MDKDILLMIEALSNEKSVDEEIIFVAIEQALEYVTEKQSPIPMRVNVDIDRKTGEQSTQRVWLVVSDDIDEIEIPTHKDHQFDSRIPESAETEVKMEDFNSEFHIRYADAKKQDSSLEIGNHLSKPVKSIDFGRISAQMARKIIARKVREAEKEMVREMFTNKIGQICTGVIKRIDRGNVIVDLIHTEAIIPSENLIPKEALRTGDRVRAIISEINSKNRNQLIILDRKSPKLVEELFKIEVPEINEDRIDIIAIARDPGIKTKIAVLSTDPRVTAYGACIGLRGSRIQAIQNELSSERIDVIEFNEDINQYVANALEPAEIENVIYDEDNNSMDVSVKEENLALSIGKSGQNVRLASQLTKVEINIMSIDDLKDKQEDEFESYQNMLSESLGVDDNIASLLVQNGFINLQSIIQAESYELLKISEFNEDLVAQLQDIAREIALTQELTGEKLDEKLLSLEGIDDLIAYQMLKKGIRTLDDLADFATDELVELINLDARKASRLIMRAREHWFENEDNKDSKEGESSVSS